MSISHEVKYRCLVRSGQSIRLIKLSTYLPYGQSILLIPAKDITTSTIEIFTRHIALLVIAQN